MRLNRPAIKLSLFSLFWIEIKKNSEVLKQRKRQGDGGLYRIFYVANFAMVLKWKNWPLVEIIFKHCKLTTFCLIWGISLRAALYRQARISKLAISHFFLEKNQWLKTMCWWHYGNVVNPWIYWSNFAMGPFTVYKIYI